MLALPLPSIAFTGDIHTYSGTGAPGFNGDGGPSSSAMLNGPADVASDSLGNIYISDSANNRIRKASVSGSVGTAAGTGYYGHTGDGGPAVAALLAAPSGVAVGPDGSVYVADRDNHRIRKVGPGGMIETVAGTKNIGYGGDGRQATRAKLNGPSDVAADALGNIYIADTGNNCVRKVDALGIITTYAGTGGSAGYSGDGGRASSAMLDRPASLAIDSSGNLYISDTGNNRVRRVSASGIITTVAGGAAAGYSGDGGPAASALLNTPVGVAVDAAGNLYIADSYNHRVRKVGASGTITTVAGGGTQGPGGPAVSAALNYPEGVAVDPSGNIFVSEPFGHRVLMVEGPSYKLPTSTITSPGGGQDVVGPVVRVTGRASGVNGVSYVEVSTDGGSTWQTVTGTADWSVDWSPQAVGPCVILSRATDATGQKERIMSCAVVNVKGATSTVSAVTLAPSSETGEVGTPIVWTATATGGTGKYEYSFWIYGPGNNNTWQNVRGFSSSGSWTWIPGPADAGNTLVVVQARTEGSGGSKEADASTWFTVFSPNLSSVTLSPSVEPGSVKNPVSWTATATGGSGKYEYSFWLYGPGNNNTWQNVQDFSASNSWSWTPGPADEGNSLVVVWARNVGSKAKKEGDAAKWYMVTSGVAADVKLESLTASKTGPVEPGTAVTWTAAASGGTGQYEYRFLKNGPSTGGVDAVARDWAVSESWTWTPTQTDMGTNYVKAEARNSDLTGTTSSMSSGAYEVSLALKALIVDGLSAAPAGPVDAGTSVTWTAAVSGGSGAYEYQFLKSGPGTGGSFTIVRNWSSSASWTWATAQADVGQSFVQVIVRNSDGSGSAASMTSVAYTVNAPPLPLAVDSITPGAPGPVIAGTAVTWTAVASGGSGAYEYRFLRSGPGTGGSYVEVRGWSAGASWTWNTSSAVIGDSTVKVEVRSPGQATPVASKVSLVYTVVGSAGVFKTDDSNSLTDRDLLGI